MNGKSDHVPEGTIITHINQKIDAHSSLETREDFPPTFSTIKIMATKSHHEIKMT